jgi:uncharacterized protein
MKDNMKNELKPFWNRFFDFNWKFGLSLIVLICIPRFLLVMNANATKNYASMGLIMVISALVPFIFLSKYGRGKIGIKKTENYKSLLIAFVIGLIVSVLLYFLGEILYGNSYENWYQYIGKSYRIPLEINPHDKLILFIIMALTGMTFSPIGEELLFRGMIHASFEKSIGEKKASIVDCSAFALVHISHFGLVFINNQWTFYTIPAIIWTMSLFLVSLLFFKFKKKSGSILGAIICHAAFNLGMIYCIFFLMGK